MPAFLYERAKLEPYKFLIKKKCCYCHEDIRIIREEIFEKASTFLLIFSLTIFPQNSLLHSRILFILSLSFSQDHLYAYDNVFSNEV